MQVVIDFKAGKVDGLKINSGKRASFADEVFKKLDGQKQGAVIE